MRLRITAIVLLLKIVGLKITVSIGSLEHVTTTHQVAVKSDLKYIQKNGSFSMGSIQICQNSIPIPVPCDPKYPYRYPDGTCNNLGHPTWCSSLQPYQRFLPANYEGFEDIRTSVKGGPLPNARTLSVNINQQRSFPENTRSNMFAMFGQLVAHDISSAIQPTEPDCCSVAKGNKSICATINPSIDDPYYSELNVTCIHHMRTYKYSDCKSKKRQQRNTVTGTIDSSTTYGADKERADYLRRKDGTGKLRSAPTGDEDLLPVNENEKLLFCPLKRPKDCFTAGDTRVNQHATLAGLETLFMREHNRIATILKNLNPSWNEEKLYQETKKFVAGQMQCIVYKEYLPLLLGQNAMDHFGLSISRPGLATRYDPTVQCGVWNSYAQAVGRLHTLVGAQLGVENLGFENTTGNAKLLRRGFMKSLLQGVCRVSSEKYDRFTVRDLRDHLFVFPDIPFGIDLAAGDILRGRDHGLPPYVDILNFCSEMDLNITKFEDLHLYMEMKNILILKNNYKDVGDVDQWVAAQMERHVPGTILGPTAIAILGRQFRVLKYGDRFFFEHEGEVPSFTPAQREALKQNCSLSRILCDNNNQQEQQRQALLLPNFENPIVSCDQLPRINLNLWKEHSP